jgi:hypothetical protein
MRKPLAGPELAAYLACVVACQRDLRSGVARNEHEVEEARRRHKAAKLDRYMKRKLASKGLKS